MFTRTFSVGKNRAFRLAVSLVLALGLVLGAMAFMGCSIDDGDPPAPAPLEEDSPLIGTWEYDYGTGVDAYKITADAVKYGSGSGDAFTSTYEAKIHEVQYFTDAKDSGMLYIEYTTKKPQYYSGSYGPEPDYVYTQTGGPFDPPGNFVVVMFHELTATTIKLANPYKASDTNPAKGTDGETDVTFIASEVSTLAAAKAKFTIDTESEFLYNGWTGVTAQTKAN
jgi:hypothetical protein